jgi:hypothetical protein
VPDIRVVIDDHAVKLLADHPAVRAAIDRTQGELVNEMKRRCPVSPVGSGHETGHLRSSIRAFRQGDGSIIIGPTADYARYVIEGTPPHEIRSHGPWPLRNRETGRVFGPVVHHPGTQANPFVREAATEVASRHAGGQA